MDTAGVIKLYRIEPDSPTVQAAVYACSEIVIADVTPLEFRSAFYGMVRMSLILHSDSLAYISRFTTDISNYLTTVTTHATLSRAEQLLDLYAVSHKLKPMDAIQLSSAQESNSMDPVDYFVTTDSDLRAVAQLEGLMVMP